MARPFDIKLEPNVLKKGKVLTLKTNEKNQKQVVMLKVLGQSAIRTSKPELIEGPST